MRDYVYTSYQWRAVHEINIFIEGRKLVMDRTSKNLLGDLGAANETNEGTKDVENRITSKRNREVNSMHECLFYTAMEVSEMLGVSKGCAYRVIRRLNDELREKGYIVIAGKIPKQYFRDKYYGLNSAS